jgi:citrate synthase
MNTAINLPVSRSSGLDGVVVADTLLSLVDGERGRLIIAGHEVEELAGRYSFEAAAHLLWTGRLPSPEEEAGLTVRLGAGRLAAYEALPRLAGALAQPQVMGALAAGVAALGPGPGSPEEQAAYHTGAIPVLAAAWSAARCRQALPRPDGEARHATDVLRLVRGGARPEPALARGLERYLVTVIDHGMNASTFTARVIASTQAEASLALAGAIGALSGPLHGGAPGPVLDMLDAIGAPDKAAAWLAAELAAGRRIMGMGHRIYRVRDPRVVVLERAARELEAAGHGTPRLELAKAVEAAAEALLSAKNPDRSLKANVELATAVLLDAVGVQRELFSAMFAAGRVAGWLAHIAEQRRSGRLIRPESRYVGPMPSAMPPA